MDNKAQVWGFTFMLGIIVLVLALALAGPVKSFTDDARNNTMLNCSNSTISNFDKATCYVTDWTIFYFIGGLIAIGMLVLGAKLIFT